MGARAAPGRATRRGTAAFAATALILAWLAPLAVAFTDDGAPACCRGRCCCRPASGDARCVSAACHCGKERRALEPTEPMPEGVLAETDALDGPASEAGLAVPGEAPARSRSLPVPHPPPRGLPSPSSI